MDGGRELVGLIVLAFAALAAVVVAMRIGGRLVGTTSSRPAGPVAVSPRFRDLIARLGEVETREDAADALAAAGADAVPDLIAALSDVRAAWDDDGVRVRMAWVMDVLGRIGDARAVAVLEPHVIRETRLAADAVRAIAALGSDDSIPLLETALEHAEHEVRAGTVRGIERAGELGRATPEFRARLAPRLAALVGHRVDAAAALLALDPAAGPLVLTSDEVLGRRNDLVAVEEVFGALVAARAPIDGALVLSHLDAFAPGSPVTDAQVGTLTSLSMALAASGHADARTRLDRMRASGDPLAGRAALAGLLVLEGLWQEDSDGGDLDVEFEEDPSDEPSAVRRTAWFALTFLEAHGLASFLRTAAGRIPADAVAALRELGAPDAARLVGAAAALFRGGVPADDAERGRRLDAATASRNPFQDLDEQVFDAAPAVHDGLRAWLVDHAAEFRRAVA